MRVFVSHTMKDRQVAKSVYSDLQKAGAQVYQFGVSESLGGDAWRQILTWISESDAFVVLLSHHTPASKGVKAEIEHANHSYINKDRPRSVIPAFVQAGAEVPVLIERFTLLDLVDYKRGIAKLIAELNLKPASRVQLGKSDSTANLFDSDAILARSGKASPLPRDTELWARDATKILSSYKDAGPPDMPKDKEATYLDGILAEYSGKRREKTESDVINTFESRLRSAPTFSLPKSKTADKSKAPVSDLLLGLDESRFGATLEASTLKSTPRFGAALETPTLKLEIWGVSWSAVKYGKDYVLESAADEEFSTPTEAYRGSETVYRGMLDLLLGARYYRVKALSSGLFADSPWSNTIRRERASRASS